MEIGNVALTQSFYKQVTDPNAGVQQQIAMEVLKDQMESQAETTVKIVETGNNKKVMPNSLDVKV